LPDLHQTLSAKLNLHLQRQPKCSKQETYWLAPDIHMLMIQENYINNTFNVKKEAQKLANISASADALADADLFESAINATNWEFGSYVASSTIQSTAACNKKYMVKFPQFLSRISKIHKNRKTRGILDNVKM
jgi:hypothetical protein